jgi:hypothetical protein
MDYLEERLSISPSEVRLLLLRNPQLIGLDIKKNLDPTIDFFEGLLGPERARPFLVVKSYLLKNSLANRLIPRRDRMMELGMEIDDEATVYKLCMKTNIQFDAWLQESMCS